RGLAASRLSGCRLSKRSGLHSAWRLYPSASGSRSRGRVRRRSRRIPRKRRFWLVAGIIAGGTLPHEPVSRRRREERMDTIAEASRLPLDVDAQPVVQAARALQPELRRHREAIEAEQRLPPPLVEQLRAAGFYCLTIPH